ncbi:unnamed protein product [Caenorhabditis sp. 36 PRJEB53466]|nr:unnamed protein product [Caenorhabditis sp. 36 PRJEB53466]
MWPGGKHPICRRLNFDAPSEPTLTREPIDFDKDPHFPRPWCHHDVELEPLISKLRVELIKSGYTGVQKPAADPTSKFRTEYRRIVNAVTIVNEAYSTQMRQLEWLREKLNMSANDYEILLNRQNYIEASVAKLKEQLTRFDSSVGILKSTQAAVKSVLELREDEYMDGMTDADLPDEYQKYNEISKLCDTALKSYDVVKKRNEEMKRELLAARNKHRRHQEAMRSLMGEKERTKIDEAAEFLKDCSLDQLQRIRDQIKSVNMNN